MRVPRSEISFLTDTTPMTSSVLSAGFSLDDRLGEQRIYLSRAFLVEVHISDRVEVSKAAWPGVVLTFMCSVWPNEMEVERVFPIRRGGLALVHQYMRGQFR
jgi:hypothetical protein